MTRKVQSRYCGKTWNAHQWYRLRQRQHDEPFIGGQREAGTYQVRKVIFTIIVPLKNIDRLESIICFSTFWIRQPSRQIIVLRGWTNQWSQFLRDRAKLEPRDLGTSSDFFWLNSWDFLLGSRFWKIRSLALPQNDKNPSLHFTRCILKFKEQRNDLLISWLGLPQLVAPAASQGWLRRPLSPYSDTSNDTKRKLLAWQCSLNATSV